MSQYFIEQSSISHFFFSSARSSLLWLLVRIYLGYEWFMAGWEKIHSPAWVGDSSGTALTGFLNGALHKTAEYCQPAPAACHPDVQDWYAAFLQNVVLPNAAVWSQMVAWGEVFIGVALIIGFFVGVTAFVSVFTSYNFLLAGTVSVNPILCALGIGLILAWRVAGHWGADRYVLPMIRTDVRPEVFRK